MFSLAPTLALLEASYFPQVPQPGGEEYVIPWEERTGCQGGEKG
jgi:hypothetical protein